MIRDDWRPEIDATLLYVVRDGEILLIHKKRGIGAGKLNGAGGKVDPGESCLDAAVREFEEELRARPLDPRKLGEVGFDVVDGASILIHVFRADALDGEPSETDEAVPLWAPVDEIPYDRMWADDRYWLPHLLENRAFEAFARFEGDRLLECEVRCLDGATQW
ncbi:8-oxo-dGTP diphosphatase [Candidatus Palauibacter sp.]|uniref:8-oxo-dGTP diphosphatase n=1 Tax=Candidatus Palauibacter sp. TaxID=3101350 RepID=UPI003CC5D2E2